MKNASRQLVATVLLVQFILPTAFAYSGDLLLGILEHSQAGRVKARISFKKEKKMWFSFKPGLLPLDQAKTIYPHQVKWRVCFDGKTIGSLETVSPAEAPSYAELGTQSIEPRAKVPTIGKASYDFAGFLAEPVYRPLVLTSQRSCNDPQAWKRFSPESAVVGTTKNALEKELTKLAKELKCETGENRNKKYVSSDFAIGKAYRNARGDQIVGLVSGPNSFVCDEAGGPLKFWFAKKGALQFRFLGYGLDLIDAGDYDEDGESEIIFLREGENLGGYVLYSNSFEKPEEFSWHYH